MALSQNTLSTLFAGAGWEYDLNERTGKFYADISYKGWYPVLTFRFDIGNRAGYTRYKVNMEKHRFTWQETNFKVNIGIPWNFTHGKYNRSLQPMIGASLIGIRHLATTPETFTNGNILSMDYRLTAAQYLRSSQKDIYSPFGQAIEINFRNTPFGGNDMGSIFAAEANLYFPGILRHQGLWIYGAYQNRNENEKLSYSFANIIAYPRGYSDNYDQDLVSVQINYMLPFWYPDFSAGSVIYLKRLKLNLFYDWANGLNPKTINTYQSMGGELTADFHLLRFAGPVEMGVRSLYFPGNGDWGFEFLYSISVP
jgi:hypothetical protein